MADVPDSRSRFGPRLNRSCDNCATRKVRCIDSDHLVAASGARGPCAVCLKRKIKCHFSIRRPAARQNVAEQFLPPKQPISERGGDADVQKSPLQGLQSRQARKAIPDQGFRLLPGVKAPSDSIPSLFVDRLIRQATRASGDKVVESPYFCPKNGIFGGRHSLTFFSDSRLQSLSECLKNDKVNGLVDRIAAILVSRLRRHDPSSSSGVRIQQPETLADRNLTALYIQLYFQNVHPMYPFLDCETWEATTARSDFRQLLERSKPWTCLYHTVLALGSQYAHAGSFEPGKGEAWKIFSVALAGFSELLLLPDSLITLQAITAMAVFGLGVNALAIEHVIMSEATRRAQNLSKAANLTGRAAQVYQKNFWLLYCLEKVNSFHFGRSSGFVDGDISCPIPAVPEATCAGFGWFLPFIQYARLISKGYTHLYSVGVSSNPNSYYLEVIEQLSQELEEWRRSLPDNGFRSGGSTRPHQLSEPRARSIALMFHYLYNSFLLTLCRTKMWYLPDDESPEIKEKREWCTKSTLGGARAVLEMTAMVEVEPFTQVWVIAGIPITALFILFDVVVHDSHTPETQTNLALLDMAAGHFSRIEYASGGSLPGSLISEFAHIAREHVNQSIHLSNASAEKEVSEMAATSRPKRRASGLKEPAVAMDKSFQLPEAAPSSLPPTLDPNEFDFSVQADLVQAGTDPDIGTDVMDLFNYFLPDLDPLFYEGMGPYCGV